MVYRKPTNTNVILNFHAICPWVWKIGLINCFLNRAFVVCSNWSLFHTEVSKLKEILYHNGYPSRILEECVYKFLNKKLSSEVDNQDKDDDSKYMITIPFIGHPSLNFKRSLTKHFRGINKKCIIVFKTFKVSNYFSLKDKTPMTLKANVIYSFEGSCDKNQTYIGKTKRHLATRVKEHLSDKSAIYEHITHCIDCRTANITNFSVIDSGYTDFEIKIKEALYIKKLKPVLNNQLFQHGSSYILNLF